MVLGLVRSCMSPPAVSAKGSLLISDTKPTVGESHNLRVAYRSLLWRPTVSEKTHWVAVPRHDNAGRFAADARRRPGDGNPCTGTRTAYCAVFCPDGRPGICDLPGVPRRHARTERVEEVSPPYRLLCELNND